MDRMSLLPMIKCSSCGVDIDILQLADHVCIAASPSTATVAAPTSPVSTASPTSPKLNRAATFGGPSFSNRSDHQTPSARMPPPRRIDSNAANRPFRPIEATPTNNYSNVKGHSPPTSRPLPKSPFMINRSVTTPVPRNKAPSSPDLPPNMDCAFPAFPRKNATPKGVQSRAPDRPEPTYQQNYVAPSPSFAPLSLRTNGSENVTRRLDAVATGAFDRNTENRPSTSSAAFPPARENATSGHRRTATQDSIRSSKSTPPERASVASRVSRSSAYSSRSVGLPSSPRTTANGVRGFAPPRLPPSSEQSEGIDAFLTRLQRETVTASAKRSDNRGSARQHSPGRKEPPSRPRRPSERDLPSSDMNRMDMGDFMSRSNTVLSSRSQTRNGSMPDVDTEVPPPQSLRPPPLLATAFGADGPATSLHTPSDSGLSDDSYASSGFRSGASSRSSPPGSVAGYSRDVSKLNRSEYTSENNFERTASPDSYVGPQVAKSSDRYAESIEPRMNPRALSPGYSSVPESPMDPAIAFGTDFSRGSRGFISLQDPALNVGSSPSQDDDSNLRQAEPRRPKVSNKGNCRGCSKAIIGKSVKDSSGRLTGRYHKQCFVCRTCADPFPTAEFYVFENSPYCEQHYHKLNGSLCGSCDRGIEGQYLETDIRQKFHPRCFTCTTCRIILRDGYFEVNGQRYCDRHAQSAAAPPRSHLGPGGYKPRNLQKRGTRLMMMA